MAALGRINLSALRTNNAVVFNPGMLKTQSSFLFRFTSTPVKYLLSMSTAWKADFTDVDGAIHFRD